MNSSPNIYVYTRLPTSGSFRTLILFPEDADNSPDSCLRGRLQKHHVPPSEVLYEILSYVWGSDSLTHEINLDGKTLRITANLHAALIALRCKKHPPNQLVLGCDLPNKPPHWGHRIIWADGICINQRDSDEKGEQVNRMGIYYENAKRTIVFLGEEADNSDLAEPLVNQICLALNDPASTNLPGEKSPSWRALNALFLRDWWKRYWIIQEVVKSSCVLIHCGSWTLEWKEFAIAVRWAQERNLLNTFAGKEIEKMEPAHQGLRGIQNLEAMRNSMTRDRNLQTWPLIHLLERCRIARCTDPRDYIYAVLGMCREGSGMSGDDDSELESYRPDLKRGLLTADYNESVEHCFLRYAKYMVLWGDGLKVLYSACYGRTNPALPSWVPNWVVRDLPWRTLAPKFDQGPDPWYSAGGKAHNLQSFELIPGSDHLVVRGIIVDTIKKVGLVASKDRQPSPREPDGVFTRDLKVVARAAKDLKYFLALANRSKPQQTKFTVDSIWRILCCDLDAGTNSDKAPHGLALGLQPTLKYARFFENQLAGITSLSEFSSVEEISSSSRQTSQFIMRTAPLCLGRRPMMTDRFWVGMAPGEAEAGDIVFIPLGSAVPLVLRRKEEGITLVGECFVDGIMGGELMVKGIAIDDVTLV